MTVDSNNHLVAINSQLLARSFDNSNICLMRDQPINITGTSSSGDGAYILAGSKISTTSGAINITGVGTDWGLFFETADILSTTGNITIDGGVRGNVMGYGTTTTFGANTTGSASGNITVLGDREWSGTCSRTWSTVVR